MTEQIKDSMETCRIIIHASEEELLNQHRYKDAKEIEVALNDMLKAFRSLQAWSEVLTELEERRLNSALYETKVAYQRAINIINQKLAEIAK